MTEIRERDIREGDKIYNVQEVYVLDVIYKKIWRYNGEIHRECGPAIENITYNTLDWFWEGVRVYNNDYGFQLDNIEEYRKKLPKSFLDSIVKWKLKNG